MIKTRALQLIILIIPGILFGWLLHQELVPSGEFVVEHQVGERSPFIDRILPDARVEEVQKDDEGDTVRPITGDPAFFFVHPHRGFDEVEVEVWFKNEENPIVELGGLARAGDEVYDLKPLQNTNIDNLSWDRLEENGILLLQKNAAYESIDDFLLNPPPRHEIATYHYQLAKPYLLPGYRASFVERTYDISLRGFHEAKTYIKNEPLRFNVEYMDMNRAEGPDTVKLLVFDADNRVVGEVRAEDDGNSRDDARPSGLERLSLTLDGLPEGVYKLEFRANRDIFFRRITTTQQKLVFLNNLYLGDEVAYQEPPRPISFWTEAKTQAFTTQHAEGLQTVEIGKSELRIEEPYRRYEYQVPAEGVVRVHSPVRDIIVNTDGHLAFSPESFFNPDPVTIRHNTDLEKLAIQYVIAEYTPPKRMGNWLVNRALFDTDTLVYVSEEDPTWKFAFSTPGIAARGSRLDIGFIHLLLRRPPFALSDILSFLKR